MVERLVALRRKAAEARDLGRRVLNEVRGDLLSPLTYPLSFRERGDTAYLCVAEAIILLTPPIMHAVKTGSLAAGAAYLAVQYVGLGILWNHPDGTQRINDRIFGLGKNRNNCSNPT